MGDMKKGFVTMIQKTLLFLLVIVCCFGCCSCASQGKDQETPTSTEAVSYPPNLDPVSKEGWLGNDNNPMEWEYDKITVELRKKVFSLSEDDMIVADIHTSKEGHGYTIYLIHSIEKSNGYTWERLCNTIPYKIYEHPRWIDYLSDWGTASIVIADVEPKMTPGHYRMIVYLANGYTHYLEFDLVE